MMKFPLDKFMKEQKKTLFTHFLATGFVDNGFKDTQFRFTVSDVDLLCLPKLFSHTPRYLGDIYRHNDLEIVPIDHYHYQDIPAGIPQAYLEMLNRNKNFVNHRIDPILGTVVFGQYTGLMFSLFGTKEIDMYFCRSGIQRVMRGERKFHRSCIFQHVTHREAIPHYGKLTQEVHNDLFINKYLKSLKRHNE